MSGRSLALTGEGRLADPALLATPGLAALLAILHCDGEEARVVGGAVRDALLGRRVADVDLASTAEPAEVMRRAEAAGLRAVPTGIEHGTVTVLSGGQPFEVTTLRQDVETDGRHAVVRFSRDFREDAERRDFTINALSLSPDGVVHDPVGGLPDLAAARVRFIGDPDARIAEDVLRILRFFRFHAAYGEGPLDPAGLAAVARARTGLARLSRERVRAELLKLLAAVGAVPVLDTMQVLGVLGDVLGLAPDVPRFARLSAEAARLHRPVDPILGLAALAGGSAAVPRLRTSLRLSNAESRRLEVAASARATLDPRTPPDRVGCLGLLFGFDSPGAADAVRLAAADAPTPEAWDAALTLVEREEAPRLPLGGAAVMSKGVTDGRLVGAVLKRLQAAWIRAGFPRDPAMLATLLEDAVTQVRAGAAD